MEFKIFYPVLLAVMECSDFKPTVWMLGFRVRTFRLSLWRKAGAA